VNGLLKKSWFLFAATLTGAMLASAQSGFPAYYSLSDITPTSPGAMKFGLYGFDNPAGLSYVNQFDAMFTWSAANVSKGDVDKWGLFAAAPHVGFGVVHNNIAAGSVTDYRLSLAGGDKDMSVGLGYGWSSGDELLFNRSGNVSLGTLIRPDQYVSIGLTGTAATSGNNKEGVVEGAARPFGDELMSLFADYAFEKIQLAGMPKWSSGIAVEPLDGVRITGRYFNTKAVSLGFQFSFGNAGIATQSQYDQQQKYAYNTYAVRIGAYDRNIFQSYFGRKEKYVDLNLDGPVKYQRYRLFDNSQTLLGLVDEIKAAKNDPQVAGIAINASGLDANSEMLWELREELKDFKASGKHVIVYVANAGIELYHFASVADKIVLDPEGTITLQGYEWGRTYLKGTLDKLGIGFDEWRFFKYKSAYETFSRDKMSDADREQWQAVVDEWYRVTDSDVTEARHLSPGQFDEWVNDEVLFTADDALKKGLVDTVGRWGEVKRIANEMEGNKEVMIGPRRLAEFEEPMDSYWSEEPRIAVIYAIGETAMDEGIKAKELVGDVKRAASDPKVKAIVLRVDSPGGDGMAADYVAEAIKQAKKQKPVIVSQGYVAGSGGYWLSMYADTIVAAPTTITGSIGVIGGWVYNKGLKESLGMSTDLVKAGEHADLGFGFRLPFIGVGIPDRDLSDSERAKVEIAIKSFYKEFVAKVASGRKKSYAEIDSLAQGRVYSGTVGKENGLVDVIGGLETAIDIAKEKAGIRPEEKIKIIEMPERGLINFSQFLPGFTGVGATVKEDPFIQELKFRLEHNGRPMPIMPLEDFFFGANE
jgi:protease IV